MTTVGIKKTALKTKKTGIKKKKIKPEIIEDKKEIVEDIKPEIIKDKKRYFIIENGLCIERENIDISQYKDHYIIYNSDIVVIDTDKEKIRPFVRYLMNSKRENLRDFYIKVLIFVCALSLIMTFFNYKAIINLKNVIIKEDLIKTPVSNSGAIQLNQTVIEPIKVLLPGDKTKTINESIDYIKGGGGVGDNSEFNL